MSEDNGSRIPGFYKLPMQERIRRLIGLNGLSPETKTFLQQSEHLPADLADHMVENCIGSFELPLGLGMNLRVNGRDVVLPMAIEEPSVVAGVSKAARLLRNGEGITAEADSGLMIGQIQILDVVDTEAARNRILEAKESLLDQANACDPVLVRVGGGARDLEVRILPPTDMDDPLDTMMVVHLLVDVRDAMGANAVNTMAEGLAPRVAEITGGRVLLRILSNLADRRVVTATGRVPLRQLATNGHAEGGLELAERIQEASVFAERDPYRAATHNKGIMNGVDAVLIALGQDWRAVEAGVHAYAARTGRYQALARWRVEDDELVGRMTLPMAVGTVGGVVRDHPAVRAAMDIAHCDSALDVAQLAAATGLAQNLAALMALSTDGIQAGHMRLHARKVAVAVGATVHEIDALCTELNRRGRWSEESARQALASMRQGLL